VFIAPSANRDGRTDCEVTTRLASDRRRQGDFFIADILDASLKDDMASMEHPLFALRAGDKRVRSYERNGLKVTVLPGATGCATIHDKDLWIYCISARQSMHKASFGLLSSATLKPTVARAGVASPA
jgi:hypothetical protein